MALQGKYEYRPLPRYVGFLSSNNSYQINKTAKCSFFYRVVQGLCPQKRKQRQHPISCVIRRLHSISAVLRSYQMKFFSPCCVTHNPQPPSGYLSLRPPNHFFITNLYSGKSFVATTINWQVIKSSHLNSRYKNRVEWNVNLRRPASDMLTVKARSTLALHYRYTWFTSIV